MQPVSQSNLTRCISNVFSKTQRKRDHERNIVPSIVSQQSESLAECGALIYLWKKNQMQLNTRQFSPHRISAVLTDSVR